jgi:O-glycosyl hydrolase
MKQVILILIGLISFQSCKRANEVITLKVKEQNTFQEIHSFGASDSWRCQFVGEHWPAEKRNKIADLLFSLENDEAGNPLGIGLSNWRFYLGAGSKEQGDSSNIRNIWRRSESFLDVNGNYDWKKYKGQRWFLQAAKQRGVPMFTTYTISPPVFFTKSGLAHSSKGDMGFNLKPDNYDDYAKYLVDVIEHFEKNEGIFFNYISPFNEPQWDWSKGNQEGTPATNQELYKYLKILSEELSSRGLKAKILAGEAGQLEFLYEEKGDNNNGDQINVFFNPKSSMYIGDFNNLEYAITSHSYFTTWPLKTQIKTRKKLVQAIQKINPKLDFHQTEFCILEKNPEIKGGWGRDLGMPTALYVARVIHSDLTIANARSWEWWTALSQFDFKDGLIHLDDGKGNAVKSDTSQLNHQLMFNGNVTETKLLWALGNYARFVRPGMFRIDVQMDNDLNLLEQATDLQVSAFKNFMTNELVIVFINHTQQDKPIKMNEANWDNSFLYITDEKRDLEKMEVNAEKLVIPQRSVSTLVIKESRQTENSMDNNSK